ncbi:unnamed protein product [Ascophyllum nodosum]
MEPGGGPSKFMMEIDGLAADLHRLGDKSVTELRKCVIIVPGLSADFEMECRMLENAGLNRAEVERVVGNQYSRLLRQQQDSKALSASKGTVTANRGKGKNRRLHHKFDGNCFNCGKKGHRAGDCRSAKKSERSGAADDKEGARGDRKEEWESDSGATFHMAHTRAGMSAYKKVSSGTTVEIADGNILPVDGFGRIEVDLDQPGHTTKMVKMDDVAYVPGLSRNLLSTIKAMEQ